MSDVKSSLELRHEQVAPYRWQLVLHVDGKEFAIGDFCDTLQGAQQIRTDFRTAMVKVFLATF